MKLKYLILIIPLILALLLSPKLTLAQEGLKFIFLLIWLIGACLLVILIWTVLAVFIETFVFWSLANKLFKTPVKFLKILLYATVANIPFLLFWVGFGLSKFQTSLGIVFVCFIFSVFIEWVIYILFLGKIIKILNLLKISVIANLISLTVIGISTNWFGLG